MRGGGKTFCSPTIMFQCFSETMYLDYEFTNVSEFSSPSSPLIWERMAQMVWSWVFLFLHVEYALV